MPDEDATPTDESTLAGIPTTSSPRDCPLCGQSVATVTIRGPATAAAAPCGCRMPPEVLLVDPDADPDGSATDRDPRSPSDSNANSAHESD